jgi:antitoxin component of MazEF toxin-antitoxin module
MIKSRIEINENGEFYTIIPEDVVAEYNYDEGDQLEWDIDDNEFIIISLA